MFQIRQQHRFSFESIGSIRRILRVEFSCSIQLFNGNQAIPELHILCFIHCSKATVSHMGEDAVALFQHSTRGEISSYVGVGAFVAWEWP